MQRAVRRTTRSGELEGSPLPQRIKEISDKVKIIRFGVVQEMQGSPWDRLAGTFTTGGPMNVEEMLDATGFEETVADL